MSEKKRYRLRLEHHFDASHRLVLDYPSPCQRLHGHRWRVIVEIEAENLDKNGMIIDFSEIKKVINRFDHRHLNDILPINPTAENIASYLQQAIEKILEKRNIQGRVLVTIYESPNASVTYG